MTGARVEEILRQAGELGTVEWIFFEGGEPFLYYPILIQGVRRATELGFRVGIVTNSYWATSVEDAREWLQPLAGSIQDFSISSDPYHGTELQDEQARNARAAAEQLGIPLGVIAVGQPDEEQGDEADPAACPVRFRGRAAVNLVERASRQEWNRFAECTAEDLREPGRVHVDPLGCVHLCQGLALGNLFREPLREICRRYDPDLHPVIGPLLAGGPAELVRRFDLPLADDSDGFADACHLCYQARSALRSRFPEILGPDQMYGVPEE